MKKVATLFLLFAALPAHAILPEFQRRSIDLGESMSGSFQVAGAEDLEFKDPDEKGNLATSPAASKFVGKIFKIKMEVNGRLIVHGFGIGFSADTEAMLFNEEETEYAVATRKPWIGNGKPFPVFRCEALRQIEYGVLSLQDTCTGRVRRDDHFPRGISSEWTRYEFRSISLERDDADGSVWLQYADQEARIAVKLHLTRVQ
jgi:hypothetical protein